MTRRGRLRRGTGTVTLLCVIAATVWFGARGGAVLMTRHALPDPDAIVVLGSHEWERLPVAASIAAKEPRAVVLLTEPVAPSVSNCHMCSERVSWLEQLGTPRERVVVLPRKVTNTFDEAAAARDYSSAHGVHRLLIVTSPYHARRALAVFHNVFEHLDVRLGLCFDEAIASPASWWLQPYDRAYVLYEWAALGWYALRHGVSPIALPEQGAAS